ncbi:hypothetical protein NCCP2222_32240 [Sporosarcina sp. NCCP-2222]|uniref:YusW family protein n=1 Tax=Sporosarcina sp. NCCP-2222 TaxID=2935073 RepID=UPI002080332E|nr:YusW family protein [Sporosarcina sp. NCCP-2222]GKV57277.1 hypothetical protein NCCP2222_32240 [Sporosarcina sp. NCCP-2222]
MKGIYIALISLMVISLAACGSDQNDPSAEEGTTNVPASQPNDTTTTDKTSDTDQIKADMDKLSFQEIEVEISYGKDKEYEAEIEQDQNEPIKAKIEDEVNQIYLNGQEAFDDLYPKVQQFDLSNESTKEETINQVLKVFNLQADYEKFEVEITYNEGSKLDVEDRK